VTEHHQALAGGTLISQLRLGRIVTEHHQALAGGTLISQVPQRTSVATRSEIAVKLKYHRAKAWWCLASLGGSVVVAVKLKYHRLKKPGGV
jgi:hypothetical protein